MALQLHPSPAASGAADGRPAKRSRSESSSKLEHEPRYRHSEQLWFDDGNLFVIAESYPIPTAFKVYYGVLAKVSPVLAEYMKATNDDPLYDGCPVLTLRRVEAQWVEAMLMWIFGRMLGRGPSQQLELVSVMAYYELGVKYKIEAMRSEGLSYLVESYPLDFKDYIESRSKSPRDRRIICYPRQAFDVAAFCGRHDLLSIAATALLHCCERSLTSLYGNVRNIADKRPFEDGILPSVWVRKCVLRGYPRLIAAYNSRVELLISESLPFAADCRTQGKCKADRDELRAWLLEAEDSSGGPPSRLWSLTDELKGYQGSILCGPCLSVCKQLWVADLRNTWRYSRLEIFGISRPVLSAAEGNVTH